RFKTGLVFLGAAVLAASALAQTKASGTANCKEDPPNPVAVGDVDGHAYTTGKSQCTWTKFEIGGVAYKDGASVYMAEIRGDKSTSSGYHTATLVSGDKCACSFRGASTSKDGKFVSGGGTWTFTSGTGKCNGIKGKGTFKGTPNADGTVTYQVDGEYSLP
ncbi:MAG: hypothetical protein ABI968_08740, partial [Acidobacteriota bacterium]